jgi:hypothetical protein
MQCQICKKNYSHLGSHLWHAHKIKARDYKKAFGLDLNYPLTTPEIREKQRKAFARNPVGLKNLTTEHSFKKGEPRVKTYYSRASKERVQSQYKKYLVKDQSGACPICKQRSAHIYSHLYNFHGILIVDRKRWLKNL